MTTKTPALSPLNLDLQGVRWPLYRGVGDDVYIRDIDWAERLGFDRPRDIRKLIKRMTEAGKLGQVVCATVAQTTGSVGGRPATEYYLTRGQALKVAAKSETAYADELLDQMIQVFLLAIGQAPVPAARALPGKVEPLQFVVQHAGEPIGFSLDRTYGPGRFLVTTAPGQLWREGCKIWVALPGNVVARRDDYVIAESAELLREATHEDLAAAGMFFTGTHRFTDGYTGFQVRGLHLRFVWAFGDAEIIAAGDTIRIHARHRAKVVARACTVIATDDVQVFADGCSRVVARGRSIIRARGYAVVECDDVIGSEVITEASGQAVVRGGASAIVHLSEQAVHLKYANRKLPPKALMAAPPQLSA